MINEVLLFFDEDLGQCQKARFLYTALHVDIRYI